MGFQVYTGKSNLTGDTLGEKVVLHLTVNVRCGSLVTFDNFFTSATLMEALHERKLFACGTVRSTRKHLPEFIKPKTKNRPKSKITKPTLLKRGEYQFQTKGPVAATKWMYSKPVCYMIKLKREPLGMNANWIKLLLNVLKITKKKISKILPLSL